MKLPALSFTALVIGATAVQAEIINRRDQCARWEYIPASEALGSPEAALLFCSEDDRVWLSLRIECRPEEKRLAITYSPGFEYTKPVQTLPPPEMEEPAEQAGNSKDDEIIADFSAIPLEEEISPDITVASTPDTAREMVFFDFRSFGYTSVAYFADNDAWQFFEPEPMSPIFSRLISGNYADISLLATGKTERLPLRGSGKALRPIVESCRKAKRKG